VLLAVYGRGPGGVAGFQPGGAVRPRRSGVGRQIVVALYCLKPQEGREVLSQQACGGRCVRQENKKREEQCQVEDPYGRGQALQQDRHRQDQAGPDEDAAHPYFEIAKSEAQAGRTLLVSDGDYKKVARMIPYA